MKAANLVNLWSHKSVDQKMDKLQKMRSERAAAVTRLATLKKVPKKRKSLSDGQDTFDF